MPIDASIPLKVRQWEPYDPVRGAAQAYKLKELGQESRMRDEEILAQHKLKEVFSTADMTTKEGRNAALQEVGKVSPAAWQTLSKQFGEIEGNAARIEEQKSLANLHNIQATQKKLDTLGAASLDLVQDYDKSVKSGVPREVAESTLAAQAKLRVQMFVDEGILTPQEAQRLNPTSEKLRGFVQQSESVKLQLQNQQKEVEANLRAKREDSLEQHRMVMEQQGQARLAQGAERVAQAAERMAKGGAEKESAPHEIAVDGKPTLATRRGGKWYDPTGTEIPAEKVKPKSGGFGVRGEQFMMRVQGAATEAAASLRNIVDLPTVASTGMFGGRKQGPGLLDANKEVLANKLTSQEAQDYQVSITGIQRNLAAIEAAGLMPSGTLTHMMDAVTFKEGDTNFTKLRKLAETRQIVERGLEPWIANPKTSPEEKEYMMGIKKELEAAVPFSVRNVMELRRAQEKNPKTTFREVIEKKLTPKVEGLKLTPEQEAYIVNKANQTGKTPQEIIKALRDKGML